jgi:hypothetical protein
VGASSSGLEQNVTHQGCPPGPTAAPLVAWTHTTAPAPQPMPAHAALSTSCATNTPATRSAANITTPWLCCRCAKPQPLWVRQGFVRHGRRPGWHHDHSP